MSLRQFHSQNKTVSSFSLGANEYPVLILSGQSNAVGDTNDSSGAFSGTQSGVSIWTDSPASDPAGFSFKTYEAGVTSSPRYLLDGVTPYPTGWGWSVEAVIGKNLQSYFGKDVYIVKSATGGQPISQWTPGSTEWINLTTRIAAAKAAVEALGRTPVFVAFVWVQGEAEVVAGNDLPTYKTRLSNLVDNVRGIPGTGMSNILFISYKLSVTYQTNVNPPGPSFLPTRNDLNVAMQEVIDTKSRAFAINTDSLSNIATRDGTHYNGSALLSMGTAGYNTIIANL